MSIDLRQMSALDRDALRKALSQALAEHAAVPQEEWRALIQLYTFNVSEHPEELRADVVGDEMAVFERLLDAAEQAHGMSAFECTQRRLYFGASLLKRLPARHDGSLMDPDHLVELFLGALPISLEAAEQVEDWRTLDRVEMLRLRHVRNLLAPALLALHAAQGDDIDERVKPWEALLPRLP
ncbi:MAG TPA: hypothetical protein VGM10_20130 [Actinocrinis sp.]|jgi:hypothetical protein